MSIIHKNQTWELIDKPSHKKVIGVNWVFKTKLNIDGSLNKLKARLVVKVFSQQYGIDYWETFSPVARLDTIRLLLALEEIYVEQPPRFAVKGKEEKVYRLKKILIRFETCSVSLVREDR
ncbi:Retrovirus-related Pol polyprotein from transposon TNT 1-94 [Gossypium australe]|uniref:Retrovirus-related Pol polyprotein from transposon TNT 1-94 n=1 Tax=Gossypium australe TaxID=47621 RepID=A0A5B6V8N7_9ROSI|nr:Retrovirus-related Pol polyprotein from transposon TNT 1-94 [Gossypium australe]